MLASNRPLQIAGGSNATLALSPHRRRDASRERTKPWSSPTVQCEYCRASFVVGRPRDAAGPMLASPESPAHIWLPLSRPLPEVHRWLLEAAAATQFLDPDFIRALSTKKMEQRSAQVWVFTSQMKGGFTAMVGVDEQRVVAQKHGNTVRNVTVRETRWTPFASQLRLSRMFVCSAGGAQSDAVVGVLRSYEDLTGLLKRGTPWDGAVAPQMNAASTWAREGESVAGAAQEQEAHRLMQGDRFKNVKFNVETTWQPAALAVEIRSVAVGTSSFDIICLDGVPRLLSASYFPQSQDRATRHRTSRRVARNALLSVVFFVLGALSVGSLGICGLAALAVLPFSLGRTHGTGIAAAMGAVFVLAVAALLAVARIGWTFGRKLFEKRRSEKQALANCEGELRSAQAQELDHARASIEALYL
jgi:hypothetical protein